MKDDVLLDQNRSSSEKNEKSSIHEENKKNDRKDDKAPIHADSHREDRKVEKGPSADESRKNSSDRKDGKEPNKADKNDDKPSLSDPINASKKDEMAPPADIAGIDKTEAHVAEANIPPPVPEGDMFDLGGGLPALPPKPQPLQRHANPSSAYDNILPQHVPQIKAVKPELALPPGSDLGEVGKLGAYQMSHRSAASVHTNIVFWSYVITLFVTFFLIKRK